MNYVNNVFLKTVFQCREKFFTLQRQGISRLIENLNFASESGF